MSYARKTDILHHFADDIYHLAPIPFIYHQVEREKLTAWHADLVEEARCAFSETVLEVPDVRHIADMGSVPNFKDNSWSEDELPPPAIGVWHNVPTNGYLKLKAPSVTKLKQLIEERYLNALKALDGPHEHEAKITESWIQFYKASDYKVLHNHERYGPPYMKNSWAGAYYIDDGGPDPSMPYSGVLSFRVRQANYFFPPRSGLLLMWPSDILHEVHPFYGSRERIVVNFNISTR